ncbi:hypothetical protein R3P38DRAFT_3170724 [Favolaschia claudopus]|uniref:Uncharacterized protein n=1 Tax=Favolaschia claudopus TaxID=2862362 RepID=A0AAW0DXN4_9AGAR
MAQDACLRIPRVLRRRPGRYRRDDISDQTKFLRCRLHVSSSLALSPSGSISSYSSSSRHGNVSIHLNPWAWCPSMSHYFIGVPSDGPHHPRPSVPLNLFVDAPPLMHFRQHSLALALNFPTGRYV